MTRPRVVVVAGTGTEVGKTFVACALARELRHAGRTVWARKPAQSFDPQSGGTTDADLLAGATGDHPEMVCPPHRWYPVPMAPPMAADALGRPRITLASLRGELARLPWCDTLIVETAGGLCSPIAHDASNVELIDVLDPAMVLLVADAGLGTIHAVRAALAALGARGAVVVLNRFDADDALHVANRRWLTDHDGLDVVVDVAAIAARVLG